MKTTTLTQVAQLPQVAAPARKTYLRTRLPMFTRATQAEAGATLALEEERCGHHVTVCAYCQTAELKAALAEMPNISHGICEPCLQAEIETMHAQFAKKARAA